MPRVLLLFIALCLGITQLQAQSNYSVSYSEPFSIPEKQTQQLHLCTNGNTMMLEVKGEKDIDITLFDASRKQLSTTTLSKEELGFQKIRLLYIQNIMNLNGEVVMFVTARIRNSAPRLMRVHLSPDNASITKKEEAGIVPEPLRSKGRADHYSDVAQYFLVTKDPNAEAYVVATIFTEPMEGAAFPYIVHYNGKHEIIASHHLVPDSRYPYARLESVNVNGDKEVWAAVCLIDKGRGDQKKSSAIRLHRLRPNDTASVLVAALKDVDPAVAWTAFNPKEQTIHVLTRFLAETKTKSKFGSGATEEIRIYAAHIHAIDAITLDNRYTKAVNVDALAKLRKEQGYTGDYEGLPNGIRIDGDSRICVAVRNYGLDLGVLSFDAAGTQTGAQYFKPKDINVGWFYTVGELHTKHGHYVMFNESGETRRTPGNPKGLTSPDAYLFALNGTGSTRSYFFGKGDESFEHRYGYFNITDYDASTDTYVLMIMEEAAKRRARLAWVNFK